jgi:hypothetical protein
MVVDLDDVPSDIKCLPTYGEHNPKNYCTSWTFLYGISEHKWPLTAIGTLQYIRTDYVRAPYIIYETAERNKQLTFSKRVRLSGGASLIDKELCLASKNKYLQGSLDLDRSHSHSNIPEEGLAHSKS